MYNKSNIFQAIISFKMQVSCKYLKTFLMTDKKSIFEKVANTLATKGLTIINKDDNRPWGGFYVIDETQAPVFIKQYFPRENLDDIKLTDKVSPKVLLVSPGARLSWQYHHRRAELWRCISGPVAVVTSDNDEEKKEFMLKEGDIIRLKQGERHRLIGLGTWGVVAEIWHHTHSENPSDEDDIVRVQDDFGR